MDAIAVLKRDHEEVERLFRQFEKLTERAHRSKQKIVIKIIRELAIHAAVEEMLFYPAVRTAALKRTPAPNVFALEVTDFTIPGNIVKEVGDEKYSKLVGSPTLQESLNLVSDVEQLNKLHSRAIRP